MSENKTVNEDSPRVNIARYSYVLLAVLVLIIAALTAFFPINNHDIWWHLKTGEHILSEKSIPSTDLYSFTAVGKPWITHEWLAEVIFYLLYLAGGLNLLIIFKVIISTLISFIFVYNLGRSESRNPLIFILLAAGICLGSYRIFVRPHLFTYLFLSILSVNIFKSGYFERKKILTLIIMPVLFLFWANIHSGFVIGLGIYWIVAVIPLILPWGKNAGNASTFRETAGRRLLPPALATVAALLNPSGIHAFTYPFILNFATCNLKNGKAHEK